MGGIDIHVFEGLDPFAIRVPSVPEPLQHGVADNNVVVYTGTTKWAVLKRNVIAPLVHPFFDDHAPVGHVLGPRVYGDVRRVIC